MKPNSINSTVFANGWRCGAVLLASVCLVWVAFVSSSAQLPTLKRVTALQLGQAAQGARVTIVSDSALNDYEAFRRGDRFYVKIPQAEFAFSQPRFSGDGFDNVQVQRVGDNVVVSFKLQPGASAHVEEHSNRLEVIFSASNRSQRGNPANLASNRTTSNGANRGSANQGNPNRQRDAAGPVPSDWPQVSRERFANGPRHGVGETPGQAARNASTENNQSKTKVANKTPVASSTPVSVASPAAVPNYSPTVSYNPATAISTPVSSSGSKRAPVSANSSNGNKVREWFSANRNASLLGALVLVGLLVLVAAFLYQRRTAPTSATRVKRPLAQPKYHNKVELDEVTEAQPERSAAAASSMSQAPQKSENRVTPQPSFAASAGVSASREAVHAKPSINPAIVADRESASEEREVFEL